MPQLAAFASRLTAVGLLCLPPSIVSAQTAVPDRPAAVANKTLRDGAHDFDFEFGVRKAHIVRRLRPLTGSNEWVEYRGISTVRPVWGGRANLGELDVRGPAGAILGMSLRLYEPATRQWKISWANAQDGVLTKAMVGSFDGNGRGEFYNEDELGGRQILARFIFTNTNARAFRIVQAFSGDGGKTWEDNWIADFEP